MKYWIPLAKQICIRSPRRARWSNLAFSPTNRRLKRPSIPRAEEKLWCCRVLLWWICREECAAGGSPACRDCIDYIIPLLWLSALKQSSAQPLVGGRKESSLCWTHFFVLFAAGNYCALEWAVRASRVPIKRSSSKSGAAINWMSLIRGIIDRNIERKLFSTE